MDGQIAEPYIGWARSKAFRYHAVYIFAGAWQTACGARVIRNTLIPSGNPKCFKCVAAVKRNFLARS